VLIKGKGVHREVGYEGSQMETDVKWSDKSRTAQTGTSYKAYHVDYEHWIAKPEKILIFYG